MSFAGSSPSLRLTQRNLQRLTDSLESQSDSFPRISRPTSPTRSTNDLDIKLKLAVHQVFVDAGHRLPSALEEHVSTVVLAPRNPTLPPSPNAVKIQSHRRLAAQQNRRNGIESIEPYMLFRGAIEDDIRVAGEPLIVSKTGIDLNRDYLPSALHCTFQRDWRELSQSIPDTAIRYVTRRDAQCVRPQCATAFTAHEERLLDRFFLTQYLLFPFLTSQWTSPNSNEKITHACNRAALDGAVIVNYLREFYSLAYPDQQPSVVDTAHYSLTCNLHTAQIWVHWHDEKGYHMEMIFEFSLRKEHDIVTARGFLQNILNYALGDRLQNIKQALTAFETSRLNGREPMTTG